MRARKCRRIPGDGGRLGGKQSLATAGKTLANNDKWLEKDDKMLAKPAKSLSRPAKRPLFETFTKLAVGVILANACAWVWCSYGLAYLGRYEIAESLSQTAVDAILGVFISYAVKSAVENVNKHGIGLAAKTKKPDDNAGLKRDF